MTSLLKLFIVVLPIMAWYFTNYTHENIHKTEIKYCVKKFNVNKMVRDLPGVINNNNIVDEKLYNIYYDRIYDNVLILCQQHCRGH